MTDISEAFCRTELLIGEEALQHLRSTHVLLVGLGGVGGITAHLLVRAGIGRLTLVDGDRVSPSNLNRQMVAYQDTLGAFKTEALAQELRRIQPDVNLTLVSQYLTPEEVAPLFEECRPDFVVDAIDTLAPKTELLVEAHKRSIPVVSSMGAGAKLDPTALRIEDISASHTCALAKAVRKALRERGVHKGIPVVFSTEKALPHAIQSTTAEPGKRSTVGTISYMPNLFGCFLASYVLRQLVTPYLPTTD